MLPFGALKDKNIKTSINKRSPSTILHNATLSVCKKSRAISKNRGRFQDRIVKN